MAEEGFQDFLEEARESLTDLEENITTLENDDNLIDELNFIFRHIHSIKGASSFFKFESLATTSHKLENLLDQMRKHERELTDDVKEILSEGFFLLQEMVERGLSGDLEMSDKDKDFIERLTKVLDGEQDGNELEMIYRKLQQNSYDSFDDLKIELETILFVQETHNEAPPLHSELHLIRELLQKQIDSDFPEAIPKIKGNVQQLLVYYTEEGEKEHTKPLRQFFESYKALIDSPVGIDEMLGQVLMEELYAASPELIKADENIKKRNSGEPQVEQKGDKKDDQKPAAAAESSVRIKVPLLEEIMNLMGELVLSRNQLKSYTDLYQENELNSITQNISTITSELQEKVMKTRLQPVSIIFKPLPGVVREIARTLNKRVKLETEGQTTELDRSILNGIKDPLTHVLRNSLDHGIEPLEDRVKTDKPEEATIKLKAYYEGSQVVIEISDDGRGVNVEKVRAKALENGLMSSEELNKLTEQETCQLIFMAGFSTADQVSEVSGRGVGMDVVRSNIENLGGHIELDSQWGKGTVLKFKIPLTLAIIPALVVEAEGTKYSIPQENLVEMVLVKANDPDQKFEELNGTTVFRLRENILPVVKFNELLGLPDLEQESDAMHVIILNSGGNTFGLIVEVLHDIEEIVVKSLDHFLENHQLFSGATILGDGSISLILDVLLIAERFNMTGRHGKMEQAYDNTHASSHEGQLLTFSINSSQVYGVLLEGVYRLENIKSSRVESLGGKWFLQYRGGVLPLISSWKVMEVEIDKLPEDINIIVFSEAGQEIGLVVGSIEDTMPLTSPIVTDLVVDERFLGSSIVNKKVITILNLQNLAQIVISNPLKEKERVLLWDDSDESRKTHAKQLREQGYEVDEAGSKKEAEELMDANLIDIVVTTSSLNENDVKDFSKDLGGEISVMSFGEVSAKDLQYQEKLDSSQLSEGLKDLGQSS